MTQSDAASAVSSEDPSLPEKEPIVLRREAMAPWQALTLQAYIASHLHSTIRVMDLVRIVQFAPNRFDRVFKNSFGCTPHQYVMRTRISPAGLASGVTKQRACQVEGGLQTAFG